MNLMLQEKTTKKRRSFDEKVELAKRLLTISESEFPAISKEFGISVHQLALWKEAFIAAGASGLRALENKGKISPQLLREAEQVIYSFLKTTYPQNAFEIMNRGNRVTVFYDKKNAHFGQPIKMSLFQLRYTPDDNRWHLYWLRDDGNWWPYISGKENHTLLECLINLKEDQKSAFWN